MLRCPAISLLWLEGLFLKDGSPLKDSIKANLSPSTWFEGSKIGYLGDYLFLAEKTARAALKVWDKSWPKFDYFFISSTF